MHLSFPKRFLASVRRDFPVLFVLLPFVVGQVMAMMLDGRVVFALLGLAATFGAFSRRSLGGLLRISPAVFGWITVYISYTDPLPIPSASLSYLIRVESRVRYRTAGAMEFEGIFSPRGAGVRAEKAIFRAKDLPWKNSRSLKEGAVFAARIKCRLLSSAEGPLSFDMTMLRRGVGLVCEIQHGSEELIPGRGAWDALREASVARVYAIGGINEDSGLLLSMLIGEPDTLGDRAEAAFKKTGLAHLLVVSGYQVTLLYYICYQLLWFFFLMSRHFVTAMPVPFLCSLGALGAAFFYASLTGFDGSVMRAFIAVVIMVFANTLERRKSFLHSIIITLLVLSVFWPGCYLEPGTQLTFAALFGICLGADRHSPILRQYFGITAIASALTAVVSMWWFGIFSLLSLILNPLLAEPVSIVVCKMGLAGLMLNLMGIDRHGILLSLLIKGIHGFKSAVVWSASLPCIGFEPNVWGKWIVTLGIAGIVLFRSRRRVAAYLAEGGLRWNSRQSI